ncbi:hypothetical protein F4806DRAFT_375987 [Annulohypoxylon nitens]|nr:hypothetical protein F4806DRAFT_375987 [Annulohypoxylon nitens]
MAIRQLEGRRLSFKNNMRPRARYFYFLFIVAQLRVAWRNEYRKDPSKVLAKQLGKGFWATKGCYLQRSFLLALADEIGHVTNFAENIPIEPGDDNDPDYTGVIGIARLRTTKTRMMNRLNDAYYFVGRHAGVSWIFEYKVPRLWDWVKSLENTMRP